MHIENLKIFTDLIESQNFSHTARLNKITQSAVSQQVRKMEKQFKINIIDRSQKTFRLTGEGEKIYAMAKEMLNLYDGLNAELLGMRNSVSGTIHVSTIYSIGLHEFPPYVKAFLKKFSEVNIRVEYRRSDQVYNDILQNASDLGLVAYPVNNRSIEIIPFLEDHMAVICHPEHPLAKNDEIDLSELKQYEIVGFEKDIPTRKAVDRIFRKLNQDLSYVMEFDNIETIKRAVEIDAGIAIVPSTTIRGEVQQGALKQIKIKGTPITRPLAIIHRKGRILTPSLEKLISLLTGETLI